MGTISNLSSFTAYPIFRNTLIWRHSRWELI